MHILTSAAGILISTSVLVVLFRRRVGSLRFVDLVALFAPAVVINALLVTVLQIIMQLSRYQAIYVFAYAEALAGTIVLAVLLWCCCRSFLMTGRLHAIGIVILCALLDYFASYPITYALVSLELFLVSPLLNAA